MSESGWYPIDVRLQFGSSTTLGWNSNNYRGVRRKQWNRGTMADLVDDGSGTLLRTTLTAPAATVQSVSRTAAGLTATVRYLPEANEGTASVYAVWGAYAGETRASWTGSKLVGTASTDSPVVSASLTAVELAGATYVRFVAEPASSTR